MGEYGFVCSNLQSVLSAIHREAESVTRNLPRLIAVSKTFPKEAIVAAYNDGQRYFGENYVKELATKSEELKTACPDIKWHFIGNLQTNKIKEIMRIENLHCIESVHSFKQAKVISDVVAKRTEKVPMKIFVQVNTSNEDIKSGVNLTEIESIAKEIVEKAPLVRLAGLMTIGSFSESQRADDNSDFDRLVDARARVAETLKCAETDLELSMGMSSDYLVAIRKGSTNVRVGSAIFGNRFYPDK